MEETSQSIDESALRALKRDIPKAPPSRWKTLFRSHLKVSKGKERERVTINGVKSHVQTQRPSTILPTSQHQPQHVQHSQEATDQEEKVSRSLRETLHAALKEPIRYESGFSVSRTVSVPHDKPYELFYDGTDGVQQQVMETLKKMLGIVAACNFRVEYAMGRMNDQDDWKPTILICCNDEEQRRKIKNYFETPWTIMTGFPYSVEVDPVVLASGNVDLKPLRGSVVRVHNPAIRETMCGLACEVFADKDKAVSTNLDSASPAHPLARLTLGGLICVDNQRLYALTTAHSFIESSKPNDTFAHIPSKIFY